MMNPLLHSRSSTQGSAVLIILILLSLMAVLVVSNSVSLRRLKVELELLEQKQQHKFSLPPQEAKPEVRNPRSE